MFSLSELAPLSQHQNKCQLLKPWWEVFMDYLVVLMLLTSILACTEQLSRDRVVCIPLDLPEVNATVDSPIRNVSPMSSKAKLQVSDPNLPFPAQGRRTNLVYQQYVYISQVCHHEAVPLCSRLFPYMALLQALLLVASGSFWLHLPHTSSRIQQFLSILAKCCESPWTSQSLSNAVRQDNIRDSPKRPYQPGTPLLPLINTQRSSIDSARPLLMSLSSPPSPCPSNISYDSSLSATSHCSEVKVGSSMPSAMTNHSQAMSLESSDGEEARALFERVRKFRSHCESSTVVYKVYLAQTVFKLLVVLLIMGYMVPFLRTLSFHHTCHPGGHALVGYAAFDCIHVLSSLLHKLLTAFLILLGLYGLLHVYALRWILHSCPGRYSFHSLMKIWISRDIPDLTNDFAFLIHMLDQYDPLLVQRFAVFLSPVSEKRLLEENLERQWGEEKLHALTTVDSDGCTRLQLVGLPRIPPALFALSRLQGLKLELIADARFTGQVANMTFLRELHLCRCTVAVDSRALAVLQERLEVLRVTFSQPSQIPDWVLSLHSLQELHLTGRLAPEGGVGRSWALGSLRHLRHIRVLVIRGMLQRIPGELSEIAGSLVRLEIHNEGTRLLVLTGLKRVVDLLELHLQDCQLDRLPASLLTLTNLRTLDLQHNNLRTVEELRGLCHLRRLSCLNLAYNGLLALPDSVGALRSIESLDLSNNQLKGLPPALFTLRRLRRLLLGGNLLRELPLEIKSLKLLVELDLGGNKLQGLPFSLCNCSELRSLNVACNSLTSLPGGVAALSHLSRLDLRGNSLKELPAELGCCMGLCGGGLLVENWLFLSLPPHVRDLLSNPYTTRSATSGELSRPESDSFSFFSPAQWRFSSALESQI